MFATNSGLTLMPDNLVILESTVQLRLDNEIFNQNIFFSRIDRISNDYPGGGNHNQQLKSAILSNEGIFKIESIIQVLIKDPVYSDVTFTSESTASCIKSYKEG